MMRARMFCKYCGWKLGTLIGLVTVGVWALLGIQAYQIWQRQTREERAHADEVKTKKLQAWTEAIQYRNLRHPLAESKQEPKRNNTFPDRHIHVKVFELGDAAPLRNARYPENPAYRVTTVLTFHDEIYKSSIQEMFKSHLPNDTIKYALQGEWAEYGLSVECVATQLEDESWYVDHYAFKPLKLGTVNTLTREIIKPGD
jgi:hypothetical protein